MSGGELAAAETLNGGKVVADQDGGSSEGIPKRHSIQSVAMREKSQV